MGSGLHSKSAMTPMLPQSSQDQNSILAFSPADRPSSGTRAAAGGTRNPSGGFLREFNAARGEDVEDSPSQEPEREEDAGAKSALAALFQPHTVENARPLPILPLDLSLEQGQAADLVAALGQGAVNGEQTLAASQAPPELEAFDFAASAALNPEAPQDGSARLAKAPLAFALRLQPGQAAEGTHAAEAGPAVEGAAALAGRNIGAEAGDAGAGSFKRDGKQSSESGQQESIEGAAPASFERPSVVAPAAAPGSSAVLNRPGLERASQAEQAGPAGQISEPAAPPRPSPVARDLDLRINANPDSDHEVPIALRVAERGGEVRVSVRTGDERLGESLRHNLDNLLAGLEERGYRAEAWRPGPRNAGENAAAWAASAIEGGRDRTLEKAFQSETSENRQGGGENGRDTPRDGRRRNPQREHDPQTPNWLEELERRI
ncbi:MAG: hypothetical protein WD696_22460 [Bryobacteraceae bacterium]